MCPPALPLHADYILSDIAVLVDASNEHLTESTDVVIHGGRINAVGRGAAKDYVGGTRIDGRGLLVLPGFVNAHTHSSETLRRGLALEATLDDWLSAVWQPINRLSAHEIAVAVLLGAAEMLKRGVTATLDHFRQVPMGVEAAEAAAAAYRRCGLHATIAIMLRDSTEDGAGPAPGWPDRRDQIAVCIDLLERQRGAAPCDTSASRISFALGPSAPLRCSDELLLAAASTAGTYGALLHMHVDETLEQSRHARRRYGTSSIRHLHDLGMLGSRLSLAHAVWIDRDDIEALAESGTTVVHNPVANMRLASGRAPIAALFRAGVNIALGTDGAASNDGQDLLEAAKLAVLLSRLDSTDDARTWLLPRHALRMATDGGRMAQGLPSLRVAPGMAADLAVVDLDSPPLVPLNNIIAQIVLGGPQVKIRHVFVAGEHVVREGALTRIDEAALAAEARTMARSFARGAAA